MKKILLAIFLIFGILTFASYESNLRKKISNYERIRDEMVEERGGFGVEATNILEINNANGWKKESNRSKLQQKMKMEKGWYLGEEQQILKYMYMNKLQKKDYLNLLKCMTKWNNK